MSRRAAIFQDVQFQPFDFSLGAQGAALQQRRQEAALENQQQQARLRQADQEQGNKYIQGLNVDPTGVNTVDVYNQAEMDKLKTQLADYQKQGASTSQLQALANQKLPTILRGYTIAKNHEANIDKRLQELGKNYPSADLAKAKAMMNEEMINDLFNKDENGQVKGYKDPSIIPMEKQYGANLENEDNLHLWNTPSGNLLNHVENLPRTPYQQKESFDDKGNKTKNNVSGEISGLQEYILGKNGEDIKGIRYKAEKALWGSSSIEVMPKEQFDLAVNNAPKKAKADFYAITNPEIEKANAMKMQAVGLPLSTEEKDLLRRKMALEMFKNGRYDKSSFKTDEGQVIPKPSVTKNYINTGGKSGQEINWIDAWKDIDEQNQKHKGTHITIQDKKITNATPLNTLGQNTQTAIITALNGAGYDKDASQVYLRDVDGKMYVYDTDNVPLMPLSKQGINVTANQPLGVKAKSAALSNAQKTQTSPTKQPAGKVRVEINGTTYEMDKSQLPALDKDGIKYKIKS